MRTNKGCYVDIDKEEWTLFKDYCSARNVSLREGVTELIREKVEQHKEYLDELQKLKEKYGF